MPVVTLVIFGAGDIAAATARQLAAANMARHIVMVDAAAAVAEGKALDMSQASAVDRYDTRLTGTADESAVVSASIVVVADRAGEGGEWSEESGVALVQRIARMNTSAPIVCAGVRQRSLIDRGVHEIGLPRTRLFGTAPEALRGAVASLVALEADAGPRDLSMLVLGRPPHDVIVPWDTASIAGRRAIDVLAPPVITRIENRIPPLWPPGPMTLGSAAARVIRSAILRSPATHVLEIALTRDEGGAGRAAMLPARVGPSGLVGIERPPLSSRDRVRLDSTLAR
jgi:malate dehydrogenase